ncbi:hypothetical protein BDY24DRAFT_414395 [Mrakia frigida]|uniref:uncharacterized protein n=1 Tax=Mrakia frigida TaxID=29902 RepID=UPI003FCBF81A
MPFFKLSSFLRRILHLPKRSKPLQQPSRNPSSSSSSSPPFLPRNPPYPSSLAPEDHSIHHSSHPVSIPRRNLRTNPPRRLLPSNGSFHLPFSSRPHPIHLLLVSKGFHHLALPYFYRSINILRSKDWFNLFNEDYWILGGQEVGLGRASLDERRSWVEELFVEDRVQGDVVWLPEDAEHSRIRYQGRLALREHPVILLNVFLPDTLSP